MARVARIPKNVDTCLMHRTTVGPGSRLRHLMLRMTSRNLRLRLAMYSRCHDLC